MASTEPDAYAGPTAYRAIEPKACRYNCPESR